MVRVMTKEDYKQIQPNFEKFNIDDMNQEVQDTFLWLTSIYRELLIKYLIKKIDLKKYDDMLKNSSLNFIQVNEEEMDIYQYYANDYLTYFYLRNNIHVIALTDDERTYLSNKIGNGDIVLDSELEQFIENTYRKVILEVIDKPSLVNYGPISETFMAPNNALVIGIRYDEFALNNQTDEEWDINHDKQIEYLMNICNELNNQIKTTLTTSSQIIKYNEFSIKKKTSKQINKVG